jgi:CheY-like chemotaxis protein
MGNPQDEIVQLKAKLNQSDKLLKNLSNAARGHLYSIMELARIARQENMAPEQTADYLKIIENSGRSMNESIDDVMALRQIYMDDVQLRSERMYMVDLLNRLKVDIERTLDDHHVTFRALNNDMMYSVVLVDYSMLLQAVRKLAKGSETFLTLGKSIAFEIDKVAETENSITLKMSMRLENYSFTSSQIEGLTVPFEKIREDVLSGKDSTSARFLIIRYFMHAMGAGPFHIEDNKDRSVTISVDMPFTVVDKKDFVHIDLDSIDFTGKRILIADDDVVNLKVLEKLLLDKNAEVVSVRDGKEALFTFRNEHGRFDIILQDIILPDISGLDVARQIRKTDTIPNAKTIPIIAMTVNALHEHYFETKEAGMNAHLVKPFEPERLYGTIAEFLENNK